MISEVENMATASASWIKHPGSYIKEEMEERDWSQRDLAFIDTGVIEADGKRLQSFSEPSRTESGNN